jgi:hypothetical protein
MPGPLGPSRQLWGDFPPSWVLTVLLGNSAGKPLDIIGQARSRSDRRGRRVGVVPPVAGATRPRGSGIIGRLMGPCARSTLWLALPLLVGCAGEAFRTVDPACDDGVSNGAETGIDCGGSCQARCPLGEGCVTNDDCQRGVCAGDPRLCTTCGDGIRNGSESDLDCGGSCTGCADGQRCREDADCLSGQCFERVCGSPSCNFARCSCEDYVTNLSEASACERYVECYQQADCLPEQACREPDGTCGVNTLGGGAEPLAAAEAVWECACGR